MAKHLDVVAAVAEGHCLREVEAIVTDDTVDARCFACAFGNAVGKDGMPARVAAPLQYVAHDVLLFGFRIEPDYLHDREVEGFLGLDQGRHLDVEITEHLIDNGGNAAGRSQDGTFVACIDNGQSGAVLLGYHAFYVGTRNGLGVDDGDVFRILLRRLNLTPCTVDAHDAVVLQAIQVVHEG